MSEANRFPPPDSLTELLPEWATDPLPEIRRHVATKPQTIVVLDDDPTGTQTVYDTPVLTDWSPEPIAQEFRNGTPLFYILTNSRSVDADRAAQCNREIAEALLKAREETGRDYTVISRSDSTLRGHYPLETDVLAESLDEKEAVCLIIPFFLEGGRLTVDDTHYVVEDEQWTPAAETPFAQDPVFGFQNSNLRQWVEEKTGGRQRASEVGSIDLSTIRQGPTAVTEKLMALPNGSVAVVNALAMRDVEVVVQAILETEDQGKRFLYRTAASFVRARAGLPKRPLLEPSELAPLHPTHRGGLIVVGSHVPKTTQQWEHLCQSNQVATFTVDVAALLSEGDSQDLIKKHLEALEEVLETGRSCAIATSRELVKAANDDENLHISQCVSSALVDLVKGLSAPPKYLVAKGGITSSDLATDALGIKRALVQGQILPGIPVWSPDETSRFPGIPYVVFPGNVGAVSGLSDAVHKLELA